MMNKEVLIELMQKAHELGIAELIIGHDRVEIRTAGARGAAPQDARADHAAPPAPARPPDAPATSAPAPAAPPAPAGRPIAVKAPIPGTLYVAPAHDTQQRPLPAPGARVREGEVIALIEAMKMFNDVYAPADGTIESLPAANKSPVKVGDLIMTLAGTPAA